MDEITDYAAGIGVFVRVDMEDSAHTERTLNMVRKLSERHENVGVAIQAYLYRSEDDINELNSRRISVRLCKGAYREPAALAFPRKQDTDANYCYLTTLLLNEGRRPAFATHDQRIITWILDYARRHQVAAKSFEFQMLHGIRRDLQEQLAGDGNQVRIYVPYGTHWYPYLTRRMAERPANLLFILTQFFRG